MMAAWQPSVLVSPNSIQVVKKQDRAGLVSARCFQAFNPIVPASQEFAARMIFAGLNNSAKDDAAHFFQSAFSMDMLASAIGTKF